MRTTLSQEQVDTYRANGFIIIESFLNPDELSTWQSTVEEAVEQRLASSGYLNNQSDPKSFYAKVFTQCLKLADTHEGMKQLMHDPSLGEFVARLAGVSGIRIWHDQALFKPPYGNPTAWHLDNPYWSFTSSDAISLWVALDDATLANGCMWYLPGTHRVARSDNVGIGQNLDGLFEAYPEWLAIEPVPCPVLAGGAVLHNGLVAHGAGANMTNRPRRAMTCAYMPDGSTFNGKQNVLPTDYFESLKEGDPLNDPSINPLIWPR